MRKSTPILLSVTVLLIVSLACALPTVSVPTEDVNTIGTVLAQTVQSALTQTSMAVIPVDLAENTPTPPFTATPTLSPTATLSPTPIFTNTPLVPQVSVSMATNCRVGPGKIYDRVGALMVGEVAEVVGRDYTGNYWYIRNPDQANGYCWLWGQYATVTGNISVLPMYTPPPTPTPVPGFVAEYNGLQSCGSWWVDIELFNTGGIDFDSFSLTLKDTVTGVTVALNSNSFTDIDSCAESSSREELSPDTSPNISSPTFTYNPSGHEMQATITLCSKDGLNGICLTQVIKFKP